VAKAKSGDQHISSADLAGCQLKPFDRIACVIELHALTRLELTRRDGGLSVLRKLAVELFPKIRVGRQMLSLLLPDKLQRVAEPQIVDEPPSPCRASSSRAGHIRLNTITR
jgi:hypothetical protein